MEAILNAITIIMDSVIAWIPKILSMAISQPVILFFMAFGLVGALIRWARRLVHFA